VVDVWLKVLLSLLRLVLGTGRSFKLPPARKYLRWAQWPDDKKTDDKDYGIFS
jgi:hypothetical protein